MRKIPDQDLPLAQEALNRIREGLGDDEYAKHDFRVVSFGWFGDHPIVLDFDPVRYQDKLGPLPIDPGYEEWDGDVTTLTLERGVYGGEPGVCYISPVEAENRARYSAEDVKPDLSGPFLERLLRNRPEIAEEWQLTAPEKERLRRQWQYRYNLGAGEYNYTLFSSSNMTPVSDEKIGRGLRGYEMLFEDPQAGDPIWDAFKHFQWFRRDYKPEDEPREFLNDQWIAGSKAPALTHDGLRLFQIHDDLPYPMGDPYERLRHRYGVDLRAIKANFSSPPTTISLYHEFEDKYVDLYIEPEGGVPMIVEVLTQHHGRSNIVSTYEKTSELSRRLNARPEYLFDTRKTAYRAFEVWHDEKGLPEFSFVDDDEGITSKNNQPASTYQAAIQDEYRDRSRSCDGIAEWTTYSKLRDQVFKNGPAPTDEEIVSFFEEKWENHNPL
ncbi:hypothetical protein [Haloferax volcanii]|uniref:hypothetical protein n=1 Tax=Haloferax volcanii TaxID=2246 RepID=UPI003D302783